MSDTPPRVGALRQRGFSLVAAIFLLVILAMLGAFMVTLSTTQNITSAQDYQGSQAFRAARSGIEWAAARICYGAGVANPAYPATTTCPTMPLTDCSAVSATLVIGNYSVTVACTLNSYDEGRDSLGVVITRNIFWLESTAKTASLPGSIGYIERVVNSFVEF